MTTNQRTTENSQNSKFKQSVSVDNLAENLMEDLFNDIDRVLDGGSRLPKKVTRPEVVSLTPIKVPQIVLPQNTQSQTGKELAEAKAKKKENRSLDKLLLGTAFASILVTLSLWLLTRGGFDKILSYLGYVEKPDESSEVLSSQEADAKFADYIERSLKMIEEKEATQEQPQIPGIPLPPSNENLPRVPVSATPSMNTSLLLPLNRLVDLMEAQVAKEAITIPETQVVIIPPIPVTVAVTPKSEPSSPKLSAASAPRASTEAAKKVETTPEAPITTAKVEEKPETKAKVDSSPSAKPAKVAKKTEPQTTAKAEVKPQTKGKVDTSSSAKPAKVETTPEAQIAAKVEEKPQTKGKVDTSSSAKPTKVANKPETQIAAKVEVKPETKAKVDSSSSAKVETNPKPQPSAKTTAPEKPASQTEKTAQPTALPPPPSAKVSVTETIATNQVQTPINTLVGVLELGERSAALFEVDGIARRIYVGESIGSSGWTLVQVVNQEAVIRRNGEVRSVFVGQQF
ncbi:hypothetical protein [Okeania sp.]|uniref:hypothetical protein n=1 Tax=Okeania sp. TaxID=3100323 RepID=UPI002B4B7536|nr:hypothetical protein [Okeania sp.]MEB3342784.1 hypothetical protein [Okeania sp.]